VYSITSPGSRAPHASTDRLVDATDADLHQPAFEARVHRQPYGISRKVQEGRAPHNCPGSKLKFEILEFESCGAIARPAVDRTNRLKIGRAHSPPSNYGSRWGDPGAVILCLPQMGLNSRQVIYYLSIPSGSCYCRPMICALAPFPTCSPAAPLLASSHDGSDPASISKPGFACRERPNRENGVG
jgi:hypothetical protein